MGLTWNDIPGIGNLDMDKLIKKAGGDPLEVHNALEHGDLDAIQKVLDTLSHSAALQKDVKIELGKANTSARRGWGSAINGNPLVGDKSKIIGDETYKELTKNLSAVGQVVDLEKIGRARTNETLQAQLQEHSNNIGELKKQLDRGDLTEKERTSIEQQISDIKDQASKDLDAANVKHKASKERLGKAASKASDAVLDAAQVQLLGGDPKSADRGFKKEAVNKEVGGKKELPGGSIEGKAGIEALGVKANAGVAINGHGLQAGANAEATLVKVSASGDVNLPGGVHLGAAGSAGVGADAHANASVGRDGIKASVGAYAGAKAEGHVQADVMGGALGVRVDAYAGAGAGAEAGIHLGLEDGKVVVGGRLGAVLGVGAGANASVVIDPGKLMDAGLQAVGVPQAVQTVTHVASDVSHVASSAAHNVGSAISKLKFW